MPKLSASDLVLLAIIAYFVIEEWRYRAKRDGERDATMALLFAASVFVVGFLAQTQFGIAGLLAVLAILLIAVGVLLFRKR